MASARFARQSDSSGSPPDSSKVSGRLVSAFSLSRYLPFLRMQSRFSRWVPRQFSMRAS